MGLTAIVILTLHSYSNQRTKFHLVSCLILGSCSFRCSRCFSLRTTLLVKLHTHFINDLSTYSHRCISIICTYTHDGQPNFESPRYRICHERMVLGIENSSSLFLLRPHGRLPFVHPCPEMNERFLRHACIRSPKTVDPIAEPQQRLPCAWQISHQAVCHVHEVSDVIVELSPHCWYPRAWLVISTFGLSRCLVLGVV